MQYIDLIRRNIRSVIRRLARVLNRLSGGKLHPDAVTIFGFLMHIPIAVLIALHHFNILAAVLLVVFGLFDTLDGELARLQGRSRARGMLLDATTDRMKEVVLYTGIAYAFATGSHPSAAALAAAACGASLCVSYVKAKGESAISTTKNFDHTTINSLFRDGLMAFEIRMFVLIVGLLTNQLIIATGLIAVLASYTATQRLVRVSRSL